MIKIISKKDGFRRCGVAHTEAPTEHADDAFSDDQLETLLKEPMLSVEMVDVKKAAATSGKGAKPKNPGPG